MGILTADNSLVDAALSEILSLPLDQKRNLGPHRHVDYLLIQHHLSQVSNRSPYVSTPSFQNSESLSTKNLFVHGLTFLWLLE